MRPRTRVTENAPPLPPRPVSLTRKNNDTPMVLAFRHLKPNWRQYLSFVDLAARNGDKDCERYLKIFGGLSPKQQREHTPEQLCDLAQISPSDLIGAVCKAIWESKSAESGMVSAIAHPELLSRTVKLASKEANFKDRELFFKMTGSLPKTGTSITPQVNITFPGAAQYQMPNLPTFNTELESFDQESVNLARRLSPGTIEAASVPVEQPESQEHEAEEQENEEEQDGEPVE